jgi:hypothetical protein
MMGSCMKRFTDFASEPRELAPTQDMLFEMSNICPENSGLPFTVWISTQGDDQAQHAARVKIAEGRRPVFVASVSVESPVQVVAGHLSEKQLRLVAEWIDLNRDTILKHWRNEIDAVTASNLLKSIG